jgi:hypothetical protein
LFTPFFARAIPYSSSSLRQNSNTPATVGSSIAGCPSLGLGSIPTYISPPFSASSRHNRATDSLRFAYIRPTAGVARSYPQDPFHNTSDGASVESPCHARRSGP